MKVGNNFVIFLINIGRSKKIDRRIRLKEIKIEMIRWQDEKDGWW